MFKSRSTRRATAGIIALILSQSLDAGAQLVDVQRLEQRVQESERASGAHSEATWEARINLANELSKRGQMDQAQPIFLELLRETAGSPRSQARRHLLFDLGSYYVELHDVRRGRPLLEEALELSLQNRDRVTAFHVHRFLADADMMDANLEGATAHLEAASDLAKTAFAPDALEQALIGFAWGDFLFNVAGSGDRSALQDALKATTLALDINERSTEGDPLEQARILLLRGKIQCKLGAFSSAKTDLERSYRIAYAHAGPVHPRTTNAADALVSLALVQKDADAAAKWGEVAASTAEAHYALIVATGSEKQRLAYSEFSYRRTCMAVTLDVLFPERSDLRAQALIQVLRGKGRVLDALATSIAPSPDLRAAREELAQHLLRGPQGEQSSWSARLAELQRRADSLEQHDLGTAARAKDIREDLVAHAIPPHGALVEIVRYEPFNPQEGPRGIYGRPEYRAYVVKSDASLHAVALGPAERLDDAIREFRTAISARADVDAPARRLDALAFAPIEPLLGDSRQVFIAPDGELGTVPFDALKAPSGKYRLEQYEIAMLSTGRDLLARSDREAPRSGVTILAAPEFDAGQGRALLDQVRFEDLPGTAREAQAIGVKMAGAQIVTGPQATETFLKSLHGPRVLHVATHGFFLSDDNLISVRGSRGIALDKVDLAPLRKASAPGSSDSLLRAGLALAGANTGGAHTAQDDGVLTGLEAMSLDLRGTELVVLSACETGSGESRSGEGVFGLQRAFAIAGARQLVMSLWQVDDDATRALMTRFYAALADGSSVPSALRTARLELLGQPATAHPYFWAPFISSGKPSPPRDIPGRVAPGPRGCACDLGANNESATATLIAALMLTAWRSRGRRCRRPTSDA